MAETNIPEGSTNLENLENTRTGGQANTAEGLLQVKQMDLSESIESKAQYTMWMKQKKAIKSRVTINIETAKAELIKEMATLDSEAYTSFI